MSKITKLSAFKFGGTDQKYIKFPNEAMFQARGSLSLWFKSESVSLTQALFCGGDQATDLLQMFFLSYWLGNYSPSCITPVNGDQWYSTNHETTMATWHNIIFVWNYEDFINTNLATLTRIYSDGVELVISTDGVVDIVPSRGNSYLGRKVEAGVITYPFDGYMCDVSMWDYDLTLYDAKAIYNNGRPTNLRTFYNYTHLRHWWRMLDGRAFDGKAGSVVRDEVGNFDGIVITNGLRVPYDEKIYDLPRGIYIDDYQLLNVRNNKNNKFIDTSIPEREVGNEWIKKSTDKRTLTDFSPETIYHPNPDGGADFNSHWASTNSSGADFDTANFSFGIEFTIDVLSSTGVSIIYQKTLAHGTTIEFSLEVNASTGHTTARMNDDTATIHSFTAAADWISVGDKVRVLLRYDNGVAKLTSLDCLNISRGILYTYSNSSIGALDDRLTAGGANITIGGILAAYFGEAFEGTFGEIFFAGEEITDDQRDSYFYGTPANLLEIDSLVAYWPCDEGSLDTCYNSVESDFDFVAASLADSPWIDMTKGWGIEMDEDSPAISKNCNVGSNCFTFGMRFEYDEDQADEFIAMNGDTIVSAALEWYIHHALEVFVFRIVDSGVATHEATFSATAVGPGLWDASIVASFDGNDMYFKFWDGTLDADGVPVFDEDVTVVAVAPLIETRQILDSDLVIGAEKKTATTYDTGIMDGKIWNIFYDNRAWSEEEMKDFLVGTNPEVHKAKYYWPCDEGFMRNAFNSKRSGDDLIMINESKWAER